MKRHLFLALSAALLFSLAACGSGDGETSQSQADTSQASEQSTQEEAVEISQGGTVNIPVASEPTTLLGWRMRNTTENLIASVMYETILRMGEDGEPYPYLVESFEEDPEALTYTMTLRDGVTFHDGSTLDAETLAWNIENYMENGILTSSFYNDVESVEVVDDETVVVHMAEWDSLFPYALTRTCHITSKVAYDTGGEEGMAEKPIGTGPFRFSQWNHGVGLEFIRFDDYWQGVPNLDGVNVMIYGNDLISQASMEAGELQLMQTYDYSIADTMAANGYTVTQSVLPATAYTMCYSSANEGSPFANEDVRKAVSYAIDGQAIIDTLCAGYGEVSNQGALPGMGQYNDEMGSYDYDPEMARQLLADAGYADGFETTITFQTQSIIQDTAQILAEQLAAVGIEVTLNPIEMANYASQIGQWDGILLHPMNVYNTQYSQMAACFVQGIESGLGVQSFLHLDDINEAIMTGRSSSGEEANSSFRSAVNLVFYEHCLVKPVFVVRGVTISVPTLHDANFDEVAVNNNTLWQAWLEA